MEVILISCGFYILVIVKKIKTSEHSLKHKTDKNETHIASHLLYIFLGDKISSYELRRSQKLRRRQMLRNNFSERDILENLPGIKV